MKHLSIPICLLMLISGCRNTSQAPDYDQFKSEFNASVASLDEVSYQLRRIDTFADGNVWDNKGFAHLEKAANDTVFGFSFYAKRDDVPQISIYDQGKNFDLDTQELLYEITPGGYYFLGSPGGQMVSSSFFSLDDNYESVEVEQRDLGYHLAYTYPDDSLYMVTNRTKNIQYDASFRPVSISVSSLQQGEKTSSTLFFSDVKVNEQVSSSMENYKAIIRGYTLLEPEEYVPSDYLGTPLPALHLTNIQTGETAYLKTDKILLIDFWEVWCGWCIKSFPDVEQLYQTYKEDLEVIGIATESKEKALDLIAEKGITFSNYFQDQNFLEKFNIRSWPTYILVDGNGIMIKEYFGFKEDIERDIQKLINEEL